MLETEMMASAKKSTPIDTIKKYAPWYILVLVPLLGLLLFTVYPIIWAVGKAWFYYDGAKSTMKYVGFDNFINVFHDTVYWNSWLVTLKFAVIKLPVELPLAMWMAVLLNKGLKGNSIFRAIYYMPAILSMAVIGVTFSGMFDYFGLINGCLKNFGIATIDWFANETTAFVVLALASIWNTVGINAMYFLSALKSVPEEMYECARLEGASKPTMFFKITLPMIGPVLSTVLLLSINGTLQVNDLILVTTNGAPAGKTYSVMAYMLTKFVPGFATTSVNIGYGCATAIISSICFIIIAIIYNKLSKKLSDIY